MDNYIGRLLGDRYELLDVIGTGGMAVVYRARDNRLNRLVAVKILKDEFSENEEFRQMFQGESQAVAMLSHPNIVSVYDVSQSGEQDYIVMELLEGITLKQYLEQKGRLDWREALHFSTQIAKALDHAHSRGIVHRDIKPHNIMLIKDGSVKVADFGIARISAAKQTLTREALGSVHYISPEQARGAYVDNRSDLYSFGVVMYEMLVGRPPYDGDTPVAVAMQHINARPVLPREVDPSIPEGLEQITMHAMCASLSERYASAGQMLQDLEEFRKNPNIRFSFTEEAADQENDRVLAGGAADKMAGARTEERVHHSFQAQKNTQTKQKKRGRRIAVAAGAVCIALAIFGVGLFLYRSFLSDLFQKTEEDAVPELIGTSFSAFDQGRYPNFRFETEWKISDYEYGYVLDQSPSGGRTAKVGSTVLLTVSMGPENNTMPNLLNRTLQDASLVLDGMSIDLSVEVEYESSDVYTEGYIMQTIPASEEPLKSGQHVRLIVSQGAEVQLVEVPSVVGEDQDTALEAIDAAGLGRGSIRYDDSDLPGGTVIFQSIDPGQQVKRETVINLRVSRGPQVAQEPFILSLSRDVHLKVDDPLTLEVLAQTTDEGVLSYAWYVSRTGSQADAEVVSRSAEGNTSCTADTSVPGTYYYYCTIVNTLGQTKTSIDTEMIEVVVEAPQVPTQKTITVTMPSTVRSYRVSVRVGDTEMEPFDVNMLSVPGREIEIEVTGTGEQQVTIYLDGELYEMRMVDFSETDET